MTDRECMQEALREAELALEEGEIPVGCVIEQGGKIIARGHNQRERKQDPTAHAEVVCIREAARALGSWRLTGCTLYVTLEPCAMCAGAISQARLKRLVYAAADPAQGCAGSVYRISEDPASSHFCPADQGPLARESARLLEAFFAEHRNA